MIFIDTHTHLHFQRFDADRAAVIRRAKESGVSQLVSLGTDLVTSQQTLAMARQYHGVFACAGIHPSEAHLAQPEDAGKIRDMAVAEEKIVAIGEVGLDFYWETEHYAAQYRVFREMIDIARELALPVVIHNRSAQREMQWFFQEEGITALNGVMHCFAGDIDDARFYLEMGLHISFTANITYKNFDREVVRYVPLDRVMIETDSPYISPAHLRKERNEPANVVFAAKKMAEIYRKPLEEIAAITTENARRFFQLPSPG